MGKRDIGRVLEGSSKSPDLRIGITSADYMKAQDIMQGCQPPTSSNIENMIGSQEDDR